MSSHDARLSLTGQPYLRTFYERTYWDRLAEPSIFVPFLVLLVTVAYTTNIIDAAHDLVPSRTGDRLWNLLVAATPAPVLFAIDDWLSPFPLPRPPADRASPTALRDAKSSALARLLRRDRAGSIIASVSYAGKSGLSLLMPKGGIDRPAGLGNISNSCYQNSILQALSALGPFREYLAWITEEQESGGLPPVQTTHTLAKLVQDLYGLAANGDTFWTPHLLKRMSTFQQQDAQEYFCKLLNEVQEEVEKALKEVQKHPGLETDLARNFRQEPLRGGRGRNSSDNSDNSDNSEDSGYRSMSSPLSEQAAAAVASCFRIPLEGLMAQRIVCGSCEYSSGLTMNPFYCLTLSLGYGSSEYRLEETLDSFSAVENIEGVQCASCTLRKFRDRIRTIIGRFEADSGLGPEGTRLKQPVPYARLEAIEAALEDEDFEEETLSKKCNIPDKQRVESTKTRQVGIARAPPSIAFHINRSRFDERTGYTFKNPAAIRFPLRLDLGPWCLGSAASRPAPSESDDSKDFQPAVGKKEDDDGMAGVGQQQRSSPAASDASSVPSLPSLTTDNSSSTASEDEEQWQLPPQLPMVSGTQYNSKITGPLYELRAVITHYGQHENGHYVCYRKHPARPRPIYEEKAEAEEGHDASPSLTPEVVTESGGEGGEAEKPPAESPAEAPVAPEDVMAEPQWWRLSDQNVTLSSEAMVLSQGGVFMLFYDRIDPKSVFVSPPEDSVAGSSCSVPHEAETEELPNLQSACQEAYAADSPTGSDSVQEPDREGEAKEISYDLLNAVLAEAQATPIPSEHHE